MLPQGPATRINVPSGVEIQAFLASFRAMLAVFWAVFAPLGPFGAIWGLFRPFWALFGPLPGGKLPLVASSRVRSDLVQEDPGHPPHPVAEI